jgi:hypothetical protein
MERMEYKRIRKRKRRRMNDWKHTEKVKDRSRRDRED